MSILLSIPIFKQLLILMVVIWTIAVLLRRIGIPTIMGKLIVGYYLFPILKKTFCDYKGKGFALLLILGIGFGLFAELIGLRMTLGTFTNNGILLLVTLVFGTIISQVISAGGMARLVKFSNLESLTIGIGMTGRAEMAFILAAIGLKLAVINETIFSILIFSTFILNISASLGLKGCTVLLKRKSDIVI